MSLIQLQMLVDVKFYVWGFYKILFTIQWWLRVQIQLLPLAPDCMYQIKIPPIPCIHGSQQMTLFYKREPG